MCWTARSSSSARVAVVVQAVEVAVDELDGLEDAAGGFALPDFAEAAGAERFDQPIAANGFRIWFLFEGHGIFSVRGIGGKYHSNLGQKCGASNRWARNVGQKVEWIWLACTQWMPPLQHANQNARHLGR